MVSVWALKNKNAMTVAIFIYQQVYCRYLAPGECLIYDRGPEFANKVVQHLNERFGVNIRIISAGRPQGNGQAEVMIRTLKQKMKALMSETSITILHSIRLCFNWLYFEAPALETFGTKHCCTLLCKFCELIQVVLTVLLLLNYYWVGNWSILWNSIRMTWIFPVNIFITNCKKYNTDERTS